MIDLKPWLDRHAACEEATNWVGDRPADEAWVECDRPHWLLWAANELGALERYQVEAAMRCVDAVAKYLPFLGDRRVVIDAVAAIERWFGPAAGSPSETADEVSHWASRCDAVEADSTGEPTIMAMKATRSLLRMFNDRVFSGAFGAIYWATKVEVSAKKTGHYDAPAGDVVSAGLSDVVRACVPFDPTWLGKIRDELEKAQEDEFWRNGTSRFGS